MTHPKTTHLGDPRKTPHIDHKMRVVERAYGPHQWEIQCITCGNKHIKWATEVEYYWIKSRPFPPKFRTLWWAPRYDKDYTTVQHIVYEKHCEEKNNEQV